MNMRCLPALKRFGFRKKTLVVPLSKGHLCPAATNAESFTPQSTRKTEKGGGDCVAPAGVYV
jgi:hypothetical protein